MSEKPSQSPLWLSIERFLSDRKGWVGLSIILIIIGGAVGAQFLSTHAPDYQDPLAITMSPSWEHFFGTDSLGRDLFSRILFGSRISMVVAMVTSFSGFVLGSLYGGSAGWLGGRWDRVMMRLIELLYTLPTLLLMIFLNVLCGGGAVGIFVALSLEGMLTVARLVRGQVLQLKGADFVTSARAIGTPSVAIFYRHLFPNIIGPILVTVTFLVPTNIMYEAFLSFIGLGVQPPLTSWGTLANEGWRGLLTHPHLILFPGLAIFITIVSFNFLGNSVRDAFDPKEGRGTL